MQGTPPRLNDAFGPYRLLRILARGGMGEVYLAHMDRAGARGHVVIKILQPELADQEDMRSMFLHEARLGSLLEHPGIARIHDYGELDGVLYLAMDYVDGLPLSAIMRSLKGKVPLGAAVRIVADVASALGHAHEAKGPTGEALNIVHRDVTPQNILISKRGVVKLIDFGVAKSAGQDHRTRTGVLKGKLAYMAPEQFRGTNTNRTDVFSLGVVLHELVSGRRLFKRPTEAETFGAILSEPVPGLRAEPRAVEVLTPIVERALARDAGERYASALELEAELRSAMHHLGLTCSQQDLARLADVPRRTKRGETPHSASGLDSSSGMRMREASDAPRSSSDEWKLGSDLDDALALTSAETRYVSRYAELPGEEADDDPTTLDPLGAVTAERVAMPSAPSLSTPADRGAFERSPRRRRVVLALVAGVALAALGGWAALHPWAAPTGGPQAEEPARGSAQAGSARVAAPPKQPTRGSESQRPDRVEETPARAAVPTADTSDRDPPAEPAVKEPDERRARGSSEATPERRQRRRPRGEGPTAVPERRQAGTSTSSASAEATKRARAAARKRPPSSEARPTHRRQQRAARETPGRLFLDTDPWTLVKVNGRSLGQTPLVNVQLPAGSHVLELREASGQSHRIRVRISPGQATKRFVQLK